MQPILKKNIAIAIALLFHISGAIGILFSPYKKWFIENTSLNLLVMFGLLIFTQQYSAKGDKSSTKNNCIGFVSFSIISMFIGFMVEVFGVNTGALFGNYTYGNVMGFKLWGVPLLIGVQWFVTIYCCGVIMNFVNNWTQKKINKVEKETKAISKNISKISLIIDAALLATFFDFIIEPVAQKLDYWQWSSNEIPYFNYTCWFFVSVLLLLILNQFKFNKLNSFAIHLFIIQLLFFITLRIYL